MSAVVLNRLDVLKQRNNNNTISVMMQTELFLHIFTPIHAGCSHLRDRRFPRSHSQRIPVFSDLSCLMLI